MHQVIIIIIIIIIIYYYYYYYYYYWEPDQNTSTKVFLLFTDIYVKEVRPPDFNKDKKYAVLFSV